MEDINVNINKKVAIGIITIVAIIVGVSGMYFTGVFDSKNVVVEVQSEHKNAVVCFMDKNPKDVVVDETKDGPMVDYEVVKLEFVNNTNQVKGIYNIVPFASDAKRGKFEGVLENQIFKTDYTYMIGGQEETIKQEFQLGSGGLLIGESQKFLPKVDCDDTEFRQNIRTFSLD